MTVCRVRADPSRARRLESGESRNSVCVWERQARLPTSVYSERVSERSGSFLLLLLLLLLQGGGREARVCFFLLLFGCR